MTYQPILAALVTLEIAFYLRTCQYNHRSGYQGAQSEAGDMEERVQIWKQTVAATPSDGLDQLLARCFTSVAKAEDIRRGNIEDLLSVYLFRLPLKDVLANPSSHHLLTSLASDLERKRGRRFLSGYNPDMKANERGPARVHGSYTPLSVRVLLATVEWMTACTQGRSQIVSAVLPRAALTPIMKAEMHVTCSPRPAVPASSIAMGASMSNLSCIGMNAAPPLRTRQRSRTIDAVLACTSIPASSLAMMSSLSNLSSIGMCAAPPLRTRQRSRTIVGYANATPLLPAVQSA